jgi:hypothetical protein
MAMYNPQFTDDIYSKILMLTKVINDPKLKRYISLLEDEIALARTNYENMRRELRYYRDRKEEFDKLKVIKDSNKRVTELTEIVNNQQRLLKDNDNTIDRLYEENEKINKFLKQHMEQEDEPKSEMIKYDDIVEPEDDTKQLKKSKEDGTAWTKPVKSGWKE